MDTKNIKLLIAEGEGLTTEFKEKYTSKIDRDMTALANTRGGIILLGVADDGQITGETLTNQRKAEILSLGRNCDPHVPISGISAVDGVVVIEVAEGCEKPYSCSSGYFRRMDAVTQKLTQKEVRLMFRSAADTLFESLPCALLLSEISLPKVRAFIKETGAAFKISNKNLTAFLSSLGIYRAGMATNAAALMFAEDVGKIIPQCELIMGAFKGTDRMNIYDRKDSRQDLLTQFLDAMEFIKKHINIRSEIRGVDRHEIYEFPLDALREAVVNAIVHRDYSMRGTSVYISVYDDRVDISNPGGLLPGISPDSFGRESVRRNPVIADLFHRMGKVERMGTGIRRMRGLMKDSGLAAPEFTSDSFFHAVFYRSKEY